MKWLTEVATCNTLKKDIHFLRYHEQVANYYKDGIHVEVEK